MRLSNFGERREGVTIESILLESQLDLALPRVLISRSTGNFWENETVTPDTLKGNTRCHCARLSQVSMTTTPAGCVLTPGSWLQLAPSSAPSLQRLWDSY